MPAVYFTAAELIEHANAMSREIDKEKSALLALYQGGLVTANTDVVVTDGGEEGITVAQLYGRLEGRETELNAFVAYLISKADEKLGKDNPDLA